MNTYLHETSYLQTEDLDRRFKLVSTLVDFKDKKVIDLNCGSYRLTNYVSGFKEYVGNDIRGEYAHGGIDFRNTPDTEIDEPCDILCCFGYGYRLNKYESQTVRESIERLVKKYKPEVVVIETSNDIHVDFPVLEEYTAKCYPIRPGIDRRHHDRNLCIYRPK
jgi:hypothetical protein